MSELTLQQIANAVENIECDVFEQTDAEYLNITLTTNGYVHIVSFLGIDLWCSEDDMREYLGMDGDEAMRQGIDDYLRRAIMFEIDKIKEIELL